MVIATVEAQQPAKLCPYCGEQILAVAIKCKHCGSDLAQQSQGAVAGKKILQVALSQKKVLWFLLGSQLIVPVALVPSVGPIIALGLAGGLAFYIYKMAEAVGSWVPLLWALASLVPLLGIIVLLIINQMATMVLKNANIRVGLMGANKEDIARLENCGA
jgi:hypothetical protein